MRDLVVLRGCPGSGKSTWIKENCLEPYTISPDKIREMVCAPVYNEDYTHPVISQENENYVWALLYEILEKRMSSGDFTIIDATHSRSTDFSKYNSLCDTYRYRKYIVSFTDIPKEVCLERNETREPYKRVPAEVIGKMYARFETQEKASGWVDVPRNEFWKFFSNNCYDYNEFNKIHIIGDIHGCYEPLKEYILKTSEKTVDLEKNYTPKELAECLNSDEAYIFVGDYIDRGLQNKEVLEFLFEICKNYNVLLLQGNHERNLWYYANELDDRIKSKEFINYTINQIKDIEPSKLKQLYRKFAQMAYIEFAGNKYFVNHGGLNVFPDNLHLTSTSQFIRGVGPFKTPIDEIYTRNTRGLNIIQVHGHRNIESIDKEMPYSLSLDGGVEFGGNLVCLEITKDGIYRFITTKNKIFREQTEQEMPEVLRTETLDESNIVERLRSNSNIRESQLANNISSFNFTRKVFEKGKWDKETVKARGLFIDTEKNKIVARGYEKFFNINEQETSKLFNLKRLFNNTFDIDKEVNEVLGVNYNVVAYRKYNGFLGILSYYNDSLQFHSKSTNVGEHTSYFINLFYKQYTPEQVEKITDYLKQNDVSMTYEVIDLKNDPHIIDEKQSRIVLLDIINNTIEFHKLPYNKFVEVCKNFGLTESEYKQVYTTFNTYRQLTEFYSEHKDANNFNDTDIEGVVIESGTFMAKLKFNYYSFWKLLRTVSEMTMNGKAVPLNKLYNATANYFYKFVKEKYNKKLELQKQILEKINDERLNISGLNKGELTDSSIIIHLRKYYNSEQVTEETPYEPYEQIEIPLSNDTIEQIKELRKVDNIISLRREYYENRGCLICY